MSWQDKAPKNQVFILLAVEFDELETVYCLKRFREAGLPVTLVGLSAGLIKGSHGLVVRPDCSLDQIPANQIGRLVVVPGSKMCSTSLMSDPRVHRLLNANLEAGSYVAALAPAEAVLTQVGFPPLSLAAFFVRQESRDLGEFATELIFLMAHEDAAV